MIRGNINMQIFSKIIIDGNNLFFRNFYTHKEKIRIKNKEILSGAIFGYIKSIQKIQKIFGTENTEFYHIWDNFSCSDSIRHEIDPNYKIKRVKYDENFYESIDLLNLILLNYSNKFFTVQFPTTEADDIPPSLISNFNKFERVLVCSEDLDYSRCISDNVYWYSHNQIFDYILFQEKYGYIPNRDRIIMYKTIRGDISDNIPIGIKNIREKDVLYLIYKYQTIYDLLQNIDKEAENLGIKFVNQIKENKTRLILNFQLINFVDVSYEQLKEYIFKGEYNPKVLRTFYKMLNFEISKIDGRLLNEFPEVNNKENDIENFFKVEKIRRV